MDNIFDFSAGSVFKAWAEEPLVIKPTSGYIYHHHVHQYNSILVIIMCCRLPPHIQASGMWPDK